jgi:hypothetical protein
VTPDGKKLKRLQSEDDFHQRLERREDLKES